MVVVCPECGAKFSLEESRIPGELAKVRCSRCRHVFYITREGRVRVPEPRPPAAESPEERPPAAPEPSAFPGPETPVSRETGATGEITPESPPRPSLEPAPEPPTALETPAAPEMPAPPAATRWLWVGLAVLLLAAAGLGGWLFKGKIPGLTETGQSPGTKAAGPDQPAPAEAGPKGAPLVVTLPPLPTPAPGLKDVPVDWAQARYQGLVNTKGGQMLVIQGEVVNKGREARGPIRLKATLTDARHRPLREELFYAGTTFTESELKSLDPGEIKGWLSKPGGRSQEQLLQPGQRQPFTVVFFGTPDNLAEMQAGFQLVVVEGPTAAARP